MEAGVADTHVWRTISVRSFLEASITENVYTSFEGSCNFPTGLVLHLFAYWAILHAFMSSAEFLSKSGFLKKIFQECYKSVKQFGSRSGPTFGRAWSGSKLFSKVISRRCW